MDNIFQNLYFLSLKSLQKSICLKIPLKVQLELKQFSFYQEKKIAFAILF